MKKSVLQTCLAVFLLALCLPFAFPQKPAPSYQGLLKLYAGAQLYYDKATALSKLSRYGPREEALEKEWNENALKGFIELYRELPNGLSSFDSLRFYTAFKVGELQHYFENFGEAVKNYSIAIAIKEKSTLPDSLLFKPLLYAGIIFYNQNKFDTAVRFFKRAEAVQAVYGNGLAEGERLYNILGVLHYERGNYRQAQNYFQKALALLPLSNPYYNELFVNYQINLAQLHMRLEEYGKADTIYQNLLSRRLNLNEIYHNIGSLNLALGATDKAIEYFRKVHYQSNKIVRLYNGMGQAFLRLRQPDSAFRYYQMAIEANQSSGSDADAVGYGLVMKSLGDYYLRLNDDSAALRYYQKAICRFYPGFTGDDVRQNPERFSGVFSYINLFASLTAKADAWHHLYQQTQNTVAAEQELAAYQSAFGLMAYVERTYDNDEARLFLTKTAYAVHSKPIDVAFDLYEKTKATSYLEALYAFDQQNKAAVLTLNRQLNTAAGEAASPLLQKEQTIKTEIARLAIKAAQPADSLHAATLNNNIRDREIELGKLQESIYAKAIPQENNLPSLDDLRALLDGETALVSYHLASDKLTTLVVTQKEANGYQQALPNGFAETVQRKIQTLKMPSGRFAAGIDSSLFALFFSHLNLTSLKRLIIIPDDVLAYLPFESLQDEEGKFLIQKVAVQYQFSTALLAKNKLDFSDAKTLAMAPFAHQSYAATLPLLPASGEEIAALDGKLFFDTAATKARFLQYANDFRIVHLATHAAVGNGTNNLSYIAFWPGGANGDSLLYAQEIYNLRLKKNGLVILSACETGTGNLAKGEGVLSLSRAFAYAGCPNVITSLWKADDFSTAYLTGRIHYYLSKGSSIADAVQLAKTDYLNDKSLNPRLKQPYYWAHLVFIGNYERQKKQPWFWAALIAVPILSLLFFYIKKSRRAGR